MTVAIRATLERDFVATKGTFCQHYRAMSDGGTPNVHEFPVEMFCTHAEFQEFEDKDECDSIPLPSDAEILSAEQVEEQLIKLQTEHGTQEFTPRQITELAKAGLRADPNLVHERAKASK